MKILFITISPMRSDISVGNTYENLFSDFSDCEFKSIYLKSGIPENNYISESFQIDEKMIIKKLLAKSKKCGKIIKNDHKNSDASTLNKGEQKIFDKAHILRLSSLFILRDWLWGTNAWKTDELEQFIKDYQPDIIFTPFSYTSYLTNVILHSKALCAAKLVSYAWDDNYAFKSRIISPVTLLYYINRRRMMRKFMKNVDKFYVISSLMKDEYSEHFKKDCDLLFKGYPFLNKPEQENIKNPVKMVYTGNIAVGRWKQLAAIGKALKKINENGTKIELDIYTASPMTDEMKTALGLEGSINLKGSVHHSQIESIQKAADILVHCESNDKNEKKLVRLSFSTKLVDYFHQAKCIFAIGPEDVASIDYLIKNDAAITATSEKEIEEKLKMIIENPAMLTEYGDKAWECGKKNHQIDDIQSKLRKDFEELIS